MMDTEQQAGAEQPKRDIWREYQWFWVAAAAFVLLVIVLASTTGSRPAPLSRSDKEWVTDRDYVARAVAEGKRAVAISDRDGITRSAGKIYDTCKVMRGYDAPVSQEAIDAADYLRSTCRTFGY